MYEHRLLGDLTADQQERRLWLVPGRNSVQIRSRGSGSVSGVISRIGRSASSLVGFFEKTMNEVSDAVLNHSKEGFIFSVFLCGVATVLFGFGMLAKILWAALTVCRICGY